MMCAGGSEERTPVGYRHLQCQSAHDSFILPKPSDSLRGFPALTSRFNRDSSQNPQFNPAATARVPRPEFDCEWPGHIHPGSLIHPVLRGPVPSVVGLR